MRKVVIKSVPAPGEPDSAAETLGQMIDDGNGDPIGTTRLAREMLQGRGFDYYHAGWSNGYVETKAA